MPNASNGLTPSLPDSLLEEGGKSAVALSELSPRDRSWDKHRHSADLVADLYRGNIAFDTYAQRMDSCAQILDFKLVPDLDLGELQLKLSAAHFCRVPQCPVCQSRRSLMWKARALSALPLVIKDYPNYRWLFLTLTQKNCLVDELRETVLEMNKSFKRLTKLKRWAIEGWIKSLEVTRGKNGSAHPHFHCLLMVSPNYFSRNYLNYDEWSELWQKSARLDYKPQVHVRAVAKNRDPNVLIPEILKYSVKESDLYKSKKFLLGITEQLYKIRRVSVGGILRPYMRKLEEEPEDLIGKNEENGDKVDEGHLYFEWKCRKKKYKLK